MTGDHQQPQNAAGQADADLSQQTKEQRQHALLVRGLERLVPGVTFIYPAAQPVIDERDDKAEPHSGALGEMAEFVRQDAGKFAAGQAGCQRQTKNELDVVAEQARETGPKTGGSVDGQIHIHAAGNGRSHCLAELADKPEQLRMLQVADGERGINQPPAREQRLEHEEAPAHPPPGQG